MVVVDSLPKMRNSIALGSPDVGLAIQGLIVLIIFSSLRTFWAMIECTITPIITILLSGTQSGGFVDRCYAWIRGCPSPKTYERLGWAKGKCAYVREP